MKHIRVRFAPSPTGNLHIGGARTALFNWLYARQKGGSFVLRIDDTDLERSTSESLENILSSLRWLGLDWDEGPQAGGEFGPYCQSQRLDIYRHQAERLLREKKAYRCFCTPEELEIRREAARKKGLPLKYDGRCRNLSPDQQQDMMKNGKPYAIRLLNDARGSITVHDVIRGDVTFGADVFDDFVLVKSNGMPTYNFACAIDDHLMRISHVIRAEEHLSNTPKQILISEALGFSIPTFAHVPMILAPDRSKLSKRHGATSVDEFREMGYLPEAIINYLALLGWSPEGTDEIMSRETLLKEFDLARVSRNPAIYDTDKLTWINGHYLRETPLDKIVDQALPFLKMRGWIEPSAPETEQYARRVVATVRDRVKTLAEIADASEYFFNEVTSYEEKGVRKYFRSQETLVALRVVSQRLEKLSPFTKDNTEKICRQTAEELGISAGKIIHPIRLAVSGRTMGPGLFDILEVLGRERVVRRIKRAIAYIEQSGTTTAIPNNVANKK